MPSQKFHLPKGSGELAWSLDPILDKRPEASKALHTLLPSSSAVTQSSGSFPFLQHPSVPPPSHPIENTWGLHCCSPLSDLRSLLVGPGDLSAPLRVTPSTLSLSQWWLPPSSFFG